MTCARALSVHSQAKVEKEMGTGDVNREELDSRSVFVGNVRTHSSHPTSGFPWG